MGQRGQHVLIVEQTIARQAILELVMQRTGRWTTVAKNLDEAVAVLRSSLHPIVVYINAAMYLENDAPGSLVLALLNIPEFAETHAFIATSTLNADIETALRDQIAQIAPGCMEWLRLPAKVSQIIAAQDAAEVWLRSRG
jgi:ActR/RegA family two-component response regulator